MYTSNDSFVITIDTDPLIPSSLCVFVSQKKEKKKKEEKKKNFNYSLLVKCDLGDILFQKLLFSLLLSIDVNHWIKLLSGEKKV